jgi:hypothetical protein
MKKLKEFYYSLYFILVVAIYMMYQPLLLLGFQCNSIIICIAGGVLNGIIGIYIMVRLMSHHQMLREQKLGEAAFRKYVQNIHQEQESAKKN